jgi:hypothetical protein
MVEALRVEGQRRLDELALILGGPSAHGAPRRCPRYT